MHMSDALLSPAVGGAMYAASAAAISWSIYKMKKEDASVSGITDSFDSGFSAAKLPLMAVAGAFVFAAQMINFTIPGTGSSGHIGGGILLAGMLGGCPALLTIAAVLIIQCLFFADGGLLALGANIFNMGVIPCLIIYPLIFRPMMKWAARGGSGQKLATGRMTAAAIISAVLGLQLGAFGVVLETTASGITALPFSTFVLLMQPIHLAIGIVEGVITAAVFVYVNNSRPEILRSAIGAEQVGAAGQAPVSIRKTVCVLAVLALIVGGGLSLFASAYPDGLEWSMEKVAGTAELEAADSAHSVAQSIQEKTSILPDYDFASGSGAVNGTSVSGVVGAAMTCVLAGAAGGIIVFLKRRNGHKRQ